MPDMSPNGSMNAVPSRPLRRNADCPNQWVGPYVAFLVAKNEAVKLRISRGVLPQLLDDRAPPGKAFAIGGKTRNIERRKQVQPESFGRDLAPLLDRVGRQKSRRLGALRPDKRPRFVAIDLPFARISP